MDYGDPSVATAALVQAGKQKDLGKKKATAAALLVVACVVFVGATLLDPKHTHWGIGLVAAAAEAAMVGGLADWFAVVALFRAPLGQRWIPHTAIIPRNKDKIGSSLADFICDHFLGKAQILDKIRQFDPAERLARGLADPVSARKVADFVVRLSPRFVDMLDSDELQVFVRDATREKLAGLDVSNLLAQLLSVLTKDGRHHEAVDSLLHDVAEYVDRDEVRAMLAAKVAEELWAAARWLHVDKPIAEALANKMAQGTRQLLREMAQNREHELRERFERQIPEYIGRLQSDPVLRGKVHAFRDQVLANQELSHYVRDLWHAAMAWLRDDLASPSSAIHRHVLGAAMGLGAQLQASEEMKNWFNGWVMDTIDPLADEYREKIRQFIVDRVKAWSAEELTEQLELSLGRDLQYIRYNGTLVGALIGALLYGLMLAIRALAG
ncbi:DUF445 domain-containing protein [Dyella agri]|uniref:DUF445 domain-containing protein n=1 Tax=Dyella agri TaxID=1926869 RepID=A0ABW8KHE1_9GAMM